MTYIHRIYENINKYLKPNKVLAIFGPRQVGKTTLLNHYLTTTKLKYKLDTGDNIQTQQDLGSLDFNTILQYARGYELIVLDEAQKIPNIGKCLKIMVDQIPDIRIIATGSASFELAGQLGEPLTGRKTTLTLYPISQIELLQLYNTHELQNRLEEWLIYGGYPEVVTADDFSAKRQLITEITQSYLFKDILELEKIKSSKTLTDLLRLLAFQVGSEVSLTELGQKLGIDYKTVARYLDLLEKAYIIIRLSGFSRNLRKEMHKKQKYYFYDNGIRNALISNFNPLNMRDDIGKLWENFIIIERIKKQHYHDIYANNYFWRTWDKKEIDLIEEREGKLFGFECKWGKQTVKPPKAWLETYPNAEFMTINRENYLDFIT
ncbi:MAG: ATP-binding protein [Gammaproteobacteria bacterium]|nr:ATP-binding protein [Gammaproteobacteria bacterium]